MMNEHPDSVERSAPQQHAATSRRHLIDRMADLFTLSLRLWAPANVRSGVAGLRMDSSRASPAPTRPDLPKSVGSDRLSRPLSSPSVIGCLGALSFRQGGELAAAYIGVSSNGHAAPRRQALRPEPSSGNTIRAFAPTV